MPNRSHGKRRRTTKAPQIPPELELEARIVAGGSNFVAALGMPDEISLYTCPERGCPLAEQHHRPLRFRCTVGHGFSAASLDAGLRREIGSSLWVAVRLQQQRSKRAARRRLVIPCAARPRGARP
jgi:two-component system chemotaxis response regulator CheB